MNTQSEAALEKKLIKQLTELGHKRIEIPDESALLSNLKSQLEKHNKISLSENEFNKVLLILNRGSIFDRARILREKQEIER